MADMEQKVEPELCEDCPLHTPGVRDRKLCTCAESMRPQPRGASRPGVRTAHHDGPEATR